MMFSATSTCRDLLREDFALSPPPLPFPGEATDPVEKHCGWFTIHAMIREIRYYKLNMTALSCIPSTAVFCVISFQDNKIYSSWLMKPPFGKFLLPYGCILSKLESINFRKFLVLEFATFILEFGFSHASVWITPKVLSMMWRHVLKYRLNVQNIKHFVCINTGGSLGIIDGLIYSVFDVAFCSLSFFSLDSTFW